MAKESIVYKPTLTTQQARQFTIFFKDLGEKISSTTDIETEEELINRKDELRKKNNGNRLHANSELLFAQSLLIDLLLQGWRITDIDGKKLGYDDLSHEYLSPDQHKAIIRKRQLYSRDDQLKTESVVEFIRNMEKKRLTEKGWHSIFSLMRDGKVLHKELISVREITDESHRLELLGKTVQPYIQFVEPNLKCEQTGLMLSHIWRYFRHTWVTEYSSLPGRSIFILIRDKAAPNHPVIGIAALGSSVAQQTCRDKWIGWEGETFIQKIKTDPSSKYGEWIISTLDTLIKEIYIKDFLKKKKIVRRDLSKPTTETVKKLRSLSTSYKKDHIEKPNSSKFTVDNGHKTWEDRAQSNLFKSKRLLILADLLSIKIILNKYKFKKGSKKELVACFQNQDFTEAVAKLVRKEKSIHVGINMMDIIVCGSVAPYNNLLGGKLVCMLLTSPEIVQYYNTKYADYVSLIASSMRGKPVVRKPNLVLLGTTSLFGVGSSQYNRIKMPISELGGEDDKKIEYKELGVSEGYGVFHFSAYTKKLADLLVGKNTGGKKVNSIFGEGANPLMRKLRDALDLLQLESTSILNHRSKRVVYGITLAQNMFEVLTGLNSKVKYLLPQSKPKLITELIGKFWVKRWLRNRILNDEVLENVKENTLSYPITHRAKVPIEIKERVPTLFD
jgi:hypothetical protein